MPTTPNEPVDDIVDELRRIVDWEWRVKMSQVVAACKTAADEIESLRAVVLAMTESV
jgi:hypothetical protein